MICFGLIFSIITLSAQTNAQIKPLNTSADSVVSLTNTDFIEVYSTIYEIFELVVNDSTQKQLHKQIADIQPFVVQMFANSGASDCATIEEIVGQKFEEKKTDISWLNRVKLLMLKTGCDSSQLFYKVTEYQYNIEPAATLAYELAMMNLKLNDDRALEYLLQAVELTNNNSEKSKYFYRIAEIHFEKNNFQQARDYCLKAIEAKPDWGEPYIFIGMAYAHLAPIFGKNEFEHKAVYWLAVDKFIVAKTIDPSLTDRANELIKTYTALFPPMDEIFFQGKKVGETYTVEGWINEQTTIREK